MRHPPPIRFSRCLRRQSDRRRRLPEQRRDRRRRRRGRRCDTISTKSAWTSFRLPLPLAGAAVGTKLERAQFFSAEQMGAGISRTNCQILLPAAAVAWREHNNWLNRSSVSFFSHLPKLALARAATARSWRPSTHSRTWQPVPKKERPPDRSTEMWLEASERIVTRKNQHH